MLWLVGMSDRHLFVLGRNTLLCWNLVSFFVVSFFVISFFVGRINLLDQFVGTICQNDLSERFVGRIELLSEGKLWLV